jgi:hypothetical protein
MQYPNYEERKQVAAGEILLSLNQWMTENTCTCAECKINLLTTSAVVYLKDSKKQFFCPYCFQVLYLSKRCICCQTKLSSSGAIHTKLPQAWCFCFGE